MVTSARELYARCLGGGRCAGAGPTRVHAHKETHRQRVQRAHAAKYCLDLHLRGREFGEDIDRHARRCRYGGRHRGFANLNGADLHAARLGNATLEGASLVGANLEQADLYDTQLHYADLRRARLNGADMSDADLAEADTTGAVSDKGTTCANFKPGPCAW